MSKTTNKYCRTAALDSLRITDPAFRPSRVSELLARPENDNLLGYVDKEAFSHVFGGDQKGYSVTRFFDDLNAELARVGSYHLWVELPLCAYRCHYCPFPIEVIRPGTMQAAARARQWVDASIAEAKLWLAHVPALREAPVGELCIFGGTPTVFPMEELERLMAFYREHFNLDEASLRVEGSPDSLTRPVLERVAGLGANALTYGIQSFDDDLLRLANRGHTGQAAIDALRGAREAGISRVDADLVWGLPGQTVAGFLADVEKMIAAGFDTVVAIKLHLRSPHEVDTAIGHVKPIVWESPDVRRRVAEAGYRWPSLGEQFQMREAAVSALYRAGHYEHPTTYFPTTSAGPEIWRSLNLDQHLQVPEIGIGLGGYTWNGSSAAEIVSNPREYAERLEAGEIPFAGVTGTSADERAVRAVRMALSTCQSLSEDVHRDRFPDSSLLSGRLGDKFDDLQCRELVTVDRRAGMITLTPEGRTLVEAIQNTEIK